MSRVAALDTAVLADCVRAAERETAVVPCTDGWSNEMTPELLTSILSWTAALSDGILVRLL